MVLCVRDVSEHGRAVLVVVGQVSGVLAVLVVLVVQVAPPPSPAPTLMPLLAPRGYLQVEVVRGVLGGGRPLLHLLGGASHLAAAVTWAALAAGGPLGRAAHPRLLHAAQWALLGQRAVVAAAAGCWVVAVKWGSGGAAVPALAAALRHHAAHYLTSPASRALLDGVQHRLSCCVHGARLEAWAALLQQRDAVPGTCCRSDSPLPCLPMPASGYLQLEEQERGREGGAAHYHRHLHRRLFHHRPCAPEAVFWLRSRALHVLGVLVLAAGQHVLLASMALSALTNALKNRDGLAPAPACATPAPGSFHRMLPRARL